MVCRHKYHHGECKTQKCTCVSPVKGAHLDRKTSLKDSEKISIMIATTSFLGYYKGRNGQKRKLPVLFGQKRMYPENNSGRECCWPYLIGNTHYLPFLAKSDRVLPVIATLLSFHPFLAIFCSVLTILCSFPVGYSTTRTDQHGPQEQLTAKFRPGDEEVGSIFSIFCKQFWK